MKQTLCDKCGKKLAVDTGVTCGYRINMAYTEAMIVYNGLQQEGKEYDLCKPCGEKLKEWLKK